MPRDTTPTTNRSYERPVKGDAWADAWDHLVEDVDANGLFSDDPHGNEAHDPDFAETPLAASDLDLPSLVVEEPDRPPISQLDDGDSFEIPVRVPDGSTLEVYRWGAYDAADGSTPTGLDVELLDGSDTVQVAQNTANSEDASAPVASHTNSSGSLSIFKLRAKNDTGSGIDSPGVGTHFGFRVA